MIDTVQYTSPVGLIFLASQGDRLVGLWIKGQKYFLNSVREPMAERETPILMESKAWLDRYFAGARPAISELPLAPIGSSFRQTVWKLLCEIPYGGTTTYGALALETAARMGKRTMSAQAVGGAVGHNPISIIIPCHRVIGADGSLTGYAGGLSTKVQLLSHEGVDMAHLYIPQMGTAL